MARLPFNPEHVKGPAPAESSPGGGAGGKGGSGGRQDQPLTVSQLAGWIRRTLNDAMPGRVRVVGEVSNLSSRHHWFFSLKDEQATVRCVCFASNVRRIDCAIEDGMQIVASGRIDFYDAQGNIQLYVEKIEPVGQGALELKLRQLIETLREKGYFDPAHKRELPPFTQHVAIVSSRQAAALQDVIETARRRWPGARLYLYDVRVQGDGAAEQVARAIRRLSRDGGRLNLDAILLTRGGGSIEDLWAFNERVVADAIYACKLPVVAAIGHETDTTVAELVADVRCSTPTQAAMRLIPEREALEQVLDHWTGRLSHATARRLAEARHRLASCANRAIFRRPRRWVLEAGQRVDRAAQRLARALPVRLAPANQRLTHAEQRLQAAVHRLVRDRAERLKRLEHRIPVAWPRQVQAASERLASHERQLVAAIGRRLAGSRQRLDAATRQLEAVSPQRVLERGYSYTLLPGGELLRSPAQVRRGDELTTVLATGRVVSHVSGSGKRDSGPAEPATLPNEPARKRRSARPRNTDQGTLFDKEKES